MIRLRSLIYQVSNLPSAVFIVLVDIVKFSLETVDQICAPPPIKNRPGMEEHLSQLLWRLKQKIHKLEPGKLSKILSQKLKRIVSTVQQPNPCLACVRPWVRSPLL